MKLTEKSRRNLFNSIALTIYLIFCLTVFIASSVYMRRLIAKSTNDRINTLLSLMSDKVNTAVSMMSDYLTETSAMLSSHRDISFRISYDELLNTIPKMPYNSAGLIAANGDIYGTAGEKMDIEKQNFHEQIKDTKEIVITEPYRSSVTGSNMITMFAPIYEKRKLVGHVFLTYYLEEIQNLAYTDALSHETEVFLINPFSGNFVNCSESDGDPPGTWSNVRLIKNDILPLKGYDHDQWLKNMQSGSSNNIVKFTHNGKNYTQAYVNINGMKNWALVIRIPITELTDTMHTFTKGMAGVAALLILATLLLAFVLYNREHDRSESLLTLSDLDPLTKVMNRRGFDNRLAELFSQKEKLEHCTFMYFDIDYFKEVNDNYGHDAGDQVLCRVSETLKTSFENTGIVARIGGDEFNVFIYAPLTMADIDNIMATIRVKLKEIKLEDGTPLPVTYSAGLAEYPSDAADLKDLAELADKALYHGKENGRNNHSWYSDLNK